MYNYARVKIMGNVSTSRNQSHYIIMTVIYNELIDFNFSESKYERNAIEMINDMYQEKGEEVDPYAINVVVNALQNYGEIVSAFTPYLNKWKWERLPLLTQSILLMSYSHFYFVEKDVDKAVIIDVAVNLAKRYIDDKQAKFINGILDAGVLKR